MGCLLDGFYYIFIINLNYYILYPSQPNEPTSLEWVSFTSWIFFEIVYNKVRIAKDIRMLLSDKRVRLYSCIVCWLYHKSLGIWVYEDWSDVYMLHRWFFLLLIVHDNGLHCYVENCLQLTCLKILQFRFMLKF